MFAHGERRDVLTEQVVVPLLQGDTMVIHGAGDTEELFKLTVLF